MRYDSGQFGAFDGADNRRTVYELFGRFGAPEALAAARRAGFLKALVTLSGNGFAQLCVQIKPCSAAEAYQTFVAITGVLGVDVEEAAKLLERVVRRLEERPKTLVEMR